MALEPSVNYGAVRFATRAGRAAYLTDPATSTEQLVYGDTGWRDISTLLTNGWTGTIRIRRTLYDVKLQITTMSAAVASNGTFLIAPVGFQLGSSALGNFRGFLFSNTTPITMRGVNIAGTAAVAVTQYSTADTQTLGTFEWSTNEAWPTTLPGTAVGTIPTA